MSFLRELKLKLITLLHILLRNNLIKDVPMLKSHNIRISNTPNVLNDATAEQAITLMLAAARNTVIGVKIAMGDAQDWYHF